jgi:hypothetical protein
MKRIATSVTLRAGIATALCLSFAMNLPARLSSGAATPAVADPKTESQYRAEASRYDAAIRAIAGIATMKLDTPDDLRKALDILKREGPNLKFNRSKLVVLGLSDSTFSNAVKKKTPNKQAAEAFAKEVNADPKVVLKLDGAESLQTRMRSSNESDAATLRRAGEKLKEAAGKIKKTAQGSRGRGVGVTDEFKVIRAGFSETEQPAAAPDSLMMTLQGGPAETVIIIIICVAFDVFAAYGLKLFVYGSDPAEGAACQEKADDSYSKCESKANDLPSGFPLFVREVAIALCYSQWLLDQAACLAYY